MICWRITRREWASDPLSGEGGQHAEGRWHAKGHRIVYLAESASLATLEILAGLEGDVAPQLVLHRVEIPDDLALEVCDPSTISPQWRDFPAPASLREYGTRWLIEERSPLMRAPSVIVPSEFNVLVNRAHGDSARIRVLSSEAYSINPRLRPAPRGK